MSTKQTYVKSKLFKLREWLTLKDAARHLSIMFGEEVNEDDVLRLALDGHLTLSVNFVNQAHGKLGKLISYEDEENLPPNFLSMFAGLPEEMKDKFVSGFKKMGVFTDQFLYLDEKVTTIEGVWDLPMVCGQQFYIENKYQMLTDGPEVTSPIVGRTYVVRKGGKVCEIWERFDEPIEYETAQGKKVVDFKNESDRYYPSDANGLPDNSVLVVRTQALLELQERIFSNESTIGTKYGAQVETDLLNTNHDFYAKELKIAIEAWTELYKKNPPPHVPQGGHKKYITKWLEEKHPSLAQRARERIATIINPNPKGGASPST